MLQLDCFGKFSITRYNAQLFGASLLLWILFLQFQKYLTRSIQTQYIVRNLRICCIHCEHQTGTHLSTLITFSVIHHVLSWGTFFWTIIINKCPFFGVLLELIRMCISATENEARRFGRFLNETLRTLSRFHGNRKVYEQECSNTPGTYCSTQSVSCSGNLNFIFDIVFG